MAISSVGYDGTIDETEFSRWAGFYGGPPVVAGHDDWRVDVVSAGDRTVTVKAGRGYGYGVADTSDADTNIQLDVVAAGVRWDAIVARRDWATNTTEFVAVTGGTTSALPPSLLLDWTDQGVEADQLLALVQVTAGQQVPTQVLDLRAYGSKVVTVADLRAVPSAPLGMEVVRSLDGQRYRRVRDSSGTLVWQASGVGGTTVPTVYTGTQAVNISTGGVSGWTGAPDAEANRVRVVGNVVSGRLRWRRSGGQVPAGDIANQLCAVLPDTHRPSVTEYFWGRTVGGVPVSLRFEPTGEIWLDWTGGVIPQSASSHSMWVSFMYIKETVN